MLYEDGRGGIRGGDVLECRKKVELSVENGRQVYIPKGFGHAFLSREDNTCVVMRIDEELFK